MHAVGVGTTRNSSDDDGRVGIGIGLDGRPNLTWTGWRRPMRSAIDGVRPGTARGAVPVLVWWALLLTIVIGGRLLWPGLALVWLVVGLAVMIPVAAWWPTRRARRAAEADQTP